MTSKVEALLADIKNALDNTANEINPCFTREYIGLDGDLAELIALSHAEGVAEGAERGVRKERRRLKATRERYIEGVRFINDVGNSIHSVLLTLARFIMLRRITRLRNKFVKWRCGWLKTLKTKS